LGSGPVTDNGTLAYNHSDTVTNAADISGTGSLTHTGGGTLVLSGANSYSGATTINDGTLVVNGSLGSTTVTLASGTALNGYGSIAGPVTVNHGATLALGPAVGSLTINNTLSLNGNCVMKINKTGATLSGDVIQGLSAVTYGGALNVFASGDALAAGDSFKLFDATSYSGSFTQTNLPALAADLAWDTSGLTNGTIAVISGNSGTPPGPPSTSFALAEHLPDGSFQMTFQGTPGYGYRLWATTNLSFKPVTNTWSNLASGTFGSVGVTFTDPQAAGFSRRFYTISIP